LRLRRVSRRRAFPSSKLRGSGPGVKPARGVSAADRRLPAAVRMAQRPTTARLDRVTQYLDHRARSGALPDELIHCSGQARAALRIVERERSRLPPVTVQPFLQSEERQGLPGDPDAVEEHPRGEQQAPPVQRLQASGSKSAPPKKPCVNRPRSAAVDTMPPSAPREAMYRGSSSRRSL